MYILIFVLTFYVIRFIMLTYVQHFNMDTCGGSWVTCNPTVQYRFYGYDRVERGEGRLKDMLGILTMPIFQFRENISDDEVVRKSLRFVKESNMTNKESHMLMCLLRVFNGKLSFSKKLPCRFSEKWDSLKSKLHINEENTSEEVFDEEGCESLGLYCNFLEQFLQCYSKLKLCSECYIEIASFILVQILSTALYVVSVFLIKGQLATGKIPFDWGIIMIIEYLVITGLFYKLAVEFDIRWLLKNKEIRSMGVEFKI